MRSGRRAATQALNAATTASRDRAPARGDPLDDGGAGGVAGRGDTLRGFRGDTRADSVRPASSVPSSFRAAASASASDLNATPAPIVPLSPFLRRTRPTELRSVTRLTCLVTSPIRVSGGRLRSVTIVSPAAVLSRFTDSEIVRPSRSVWCTFWMTASASARDVKQTRARPVLLPSGRIRTSTRCSATLRCSASPLRFVSNDRLWTVTSTASAASAASASEGCMPASAALTAVRVA